MSYVVLARKYRPRDFSEMVGQDHVVRSLSNALTQGRLHHAYLFTGTRGVGKTTVSRILAKSLNCSAADGQGGITAHPCGQCIACRDIDAGRYVDYIELDAASHRGVEEITQLLDQAVYKPVLGRFKVYMIDEVHMLTNTAFNAMLKTLEEPPEYLKFVLATTDPQKVPVTVLSRCLQFNLRPMAADTVLAHLVHVLQAEGIEAQRGALRLLSRAARGSMRDALSLTDQAIAYGAGTVAEDAVRHMLGAVDRGHVLRLVEALAAFDGAALVHTVDELRSAGLSAAGTLEELATLAQEMAVLQAVPDLASDAEPGDPEAQDVQRLAALMPADETQLLYSLALHGRAELGLAPDEYSALVMVLLRMLAFKPAGEPGARARVPVARPPQALPQASPQPAPPPAAQAPSPRPAPVVTEPEPPTVAPPEPSPAPSVDTGESVNDRWISAVGLLTERGAVSALARELAVQSQCIAIDATVTPPRWTLRVERETLRQPAQRERLEAALCDCLGAPVLLAVETGPVTDCAARRDAAARAQAQAQAEAVIRDDPAVVALMQQFKTARIVPGSVRPTPSNAKESP